MDFSLRLNSLQGHQGLQGAPTQIINNPYKCTEIANNRCKFKRSELSSFAHPSTSRRRSTVFKGRVQKGWVAWFRNTYFGL